MKPEFDRAKSFLALTVMTAIVTLTLPRIVAAFGHKSDALSSAPPVAVAPSDPCLKIASADLFTAADNEEKLWNIVLEFTAQDTDRLRGNDVVVQWHDELGSLPLRPSSGPSRLPPLKVKILLDLDQTALYSGNFLDSERGITEDKKFWHGFADHLLRQFQFVDTPSADMGRVYYVDASHNTLKAVCTSEACTYSSDGLFNTLLEAVQLAYDGKTRPASAEHVKEAFADEWPQKKGETVLVIVQWRSDALDSLSYLLGQPEFTKGLFVVVIGRSSNLPPGWEDLVRKTREKYEVGLAYIAAPPGASDLEKTFKEIGEYFQDKRSNLRINVQFPYLLDRKMAESGKLKVSEGHCSSDEGTLGVNYNADSNQEARELPAPITFDAMLASSLLVLHLLLLISLFIYTSFKGKVDNFLEDILKKQP